MQVAVAQHLQCPGALFLHIWTLDVNFASSMVSGISCSHCGFSQRHQPDPLAPLGASYPVLWVCTSIPSWLGCLLALTQYPCHTKAVCVTALQKATPLLLLLSLAGWASSPSITATSTCLELQEAFCPPGVSLGCCHSESGRAVQKFSLYPLPRGLPKTSLCLPSSSGHSNPSPVLPVGSPPYWVGQPCDQIAPLALADPIPA